MPVPQVTSGDGAVTHHQMAVAVREACVCACGRPKWRSSLWQELVEEGGRNCERRGVPSQSALLLAACTARRLLRLSCCRRSAEAGDLLASPLGQHFCSSLLNSEMSGSRHPADAHLVSQRRIALPSRAIVVFSTSMRWSVTLTARRNTDWRSPLAVIWRRPPRLKLSRRDPDGTASLIAYMLQVQYQGLFPP